MKNDFLSKIKEIKGIRIIIVLLILAIVFIFAGNNIGKDSETDKSVHNIVREDYEREVEERISGIVSEIGGISEVSVMVTLESTVNYSYAENASDGKSEYVTVRDKDGNESGVILSENMPNIRGVAVVCKGGEVPGKKLEIIKLVSSLLALPENRVYVGGRN